MPVTNGSFAHHNNTSPAPMTHSTPVRPEWEASPVVRLPDWGSAAEPRSFPADYGLPVGRGGRAEVHLAHNPLDTLREEEDFQGGQYSSGAIHALEMLNQVD